MDKINEHICASPFFFSITLSFTLILCRSLNSDETTLQSVLKEATDRFAFQFGTDGYTGQRIEVGRLLCSQLDDVLLKRTPVFFNSRFGSSLNVCAIIYLFNSDGDRPLPLFGYTPVVQNSVIQNTILRLYFYIICVAFRR